MAWLERHEPCIDWRSKTLGATRNVSSRALESNETTFVMQQKHYWREQFTEDIYVLDICMSEFVNSNVHEIYGELTSFTVSQMTHKPLSDTRCDNESLHV